MGVQASGLILVTATARIFVVGATGYIGQHVVRELVQRGYQVVCLVRRRSGVGGLHDEAAVKRRLAGADVRFGEVTDRASIERDGLRGERFDAVMSCLATRDGGIADSWRIERQANQDVLELSMQAGAKHFVLLSAICLQKPKLAFQHAKLAFEASLMTSGLRYSIVRPTAFFKSLSGQVEKVKRGKPFAVFGDGQLTSCKPISEADVAKFMADCLTDSAKFNQVLPVGGPGVAITPLEQGKLLAALLGRPVKYQRVPVALLSVIIAVLSALSKLVPRLADKAEFVRIGRYYATESMLVFDAAQGRYDADATPSFGTDTLRDFYARVLIDGLQGQELGDHAIFKTPQKERT